MIQTRRKSTPKAYPDKSLSRRRRPHAPCTTLSPGTENLRQGRRVTAWHEPDERRGKQNTPPSPLSTYKHSIHRRQPPCGSKYAKHADESSP